MAEMEAFASGPSPLELVYSVGQRNTVLVLVVCGIISLAAVLGLFGLMIFLSKKEYRHTHFRTYFICLLLANTMQAWGTIMSLKWVVSGEVQDGPHCYAQGGIKQGGHLGAAVWSFVISLHLFNLLFLRYQTSNVAKWAIIAFGWSFTFGLVFIGPVLLQKEAKGNYFGITNLWCWITAAYRIDQIMLEYFFQFLSIALSFFLHIVTWLRVRGNILHVNGKWLWRSGASWKLGLGRDYTDSAMLQLAQHMIWYPVAYATMVLPAAIARLPALCGMPEIPLWLQALTGAISELSGLVNVILFLVVSRFFPEPQDMPEFAVDRSVAEKAFGDVQSKEEIVKSWGVTPFVLTRPVSETDSVDSTDRTRAGSAV
ncbi:hypothetical protein MKEN_00597300 [Mycena kentingensis (nom. inval.)]|nr:hypothetical protein MKEN_00597300 [Mycena kentingensis (nom. inval.)]